MSFRTSFLRAAAALLCAAVLVPAMSVRVIAQPEMNSGQISTQRPPTVAEARRHQAAGRWDDAARAWSRIIEADAENADAWFNFGYCLHVGGHLEDAIPVHQKAATFAQYRGIALYNLGCAYALKNMPDEAFAALFASQQAGFEMRGQAEGDSDLDSLRYDPRYAHLLAAEPTGFWGRVRGTIGDVVGTVQREAPRMQQQLAVFAQQAQQTLSNSFSQLQQMWANDQRIAAVIQRVKGVLGMDSPRATGIANGQSLLARARSLQNDDRWLEAADAYRKAAEADDDNAMTWFNLAYCLHMGGEYENAIPAHKKAATFDETRGIALYNLACAYSLTGQLDNAIEALHASRAAGFAIGDYIATDSDLDNLRDDPRFLELQKDLGIDY